MKKKISFILPLSLLGVITMIPLVSVACKTNNKNEKLINEINRLKPSLLDIAKFEKDINEKENANQLLKNIESLDKKDSNQLDKLLIDIKNALSSFEERNKQGNELISINKIVKNQENTLASDVVKKLVAAKNDWAKIKSIFDEYKISYKIANQSDLKIEIANSSHAHDDEGVIHLDLVFDKKDTNKLRIELVGFKIVNKQ